MNIIISSISMIGYVVEYITYAIFIDAVQKKDIKSIKLMLDNRVERKSWLDSIRYILYKNIDIHKNEENAFYNAYMHDSTDIIKYLLEIGEKTNSRINIHLENDYAIKRICNSGDMEMVKYFIDYCYRINDNFSSYFYNNKILIESCISGNLELVKYIIEYC